MRTGLRVVIQETRQRLMVRFLGCSYVVQSVKEDNQLLYHSHSHRLVTCLYDLICLFCRQSVDVSLMSVLRLFEVDFMSASSLFQLCSGLFQVCVKFVYRNVSGLFRFVKFASELLQSVCFSPVSDLVRSRSGLSQVCFRSVFRYVSSQVYFWYETSVFLQCMLVA